MSCYRPLKGFRTSAGVSFTELSRDDHLGSIEIPCGRCIGCRMRRASDWQLRCMHEASLYSRNCFVTLTYARDQLPSNGSLDHRDFQLFMKRLRKWSGGDVRFYMCGEYGPKNGRPHYHACLFNLDFDDKVPWRKSKSGQLMYRSEQLEKLWRYGSCTVQPLIPETASYCARYIMKKALGNDEIAKRAYQRITDDGEVVQLKPEYAAMSNRPGIGWLWFHRFGRDVYPHDFVVADGDQRRPPKYYDQLLKRSKTVVNGEYGVEVVAWARAERANLSLADNTDERRQVREKVHLARVRDLTRGDADDELS